MARLIQTEIKRVLADEILFGRLRDGGRVEIDVRDAALTFSYAPPAEKAAAPSSTETPAETEA
jgi:ATP-dependent Clp protease ATP-binding subunit ClpA